MCMPYDEEPRSVCGTQPRRESLWKQVPLLWWALAATFLIAVFLRLAGV